VLALPIDSLVPRILALLDTESNLVLEAPPGAGKTTRVPPALLGLDRGEVLVLEPRRLAARLAARRVAAEMGEAPGETVGYQVRFEDVSGPRTRLRFLTEGVLTRRLLSDPQLRGAGIVVLDEFHERHLDGDVALALLLRLQKTTRPDLQLVVMSATLDAGPIAAHLGGCPVVRSEGRLFDLTISHTPHSASPLEDQVAAAVERLLAEGGEGDILVFLPGAAEIRRAARACERVAARAGLLVLPLYGDLPQAEQDRAVQPSWQRRLILSTNIAESSITIEGVRAVIDSGLARVAADSKATGLPSLQVARISKASATQRAGRAARTGPGKAIRLYTVDDFARRPEQGEPEIARRELSQLCLELHAMGIAETGSLPWLLAPPVGSVEAAETLLRLLGALDREGKLTGEGKRMARLPLHPRLARLILEAEARGAAEDGCAIAALLSAGERPPEGGRRAASSDLFVLLDRQWEPATGRLYEQIRRIARPARQKRHDEKALLLAILAGYPDRVAKRRQGNEVNLARGGSAVLADSSVVHGRDWLVAVEIEERRERGLPVVRLASAIEPDWLIDVFPDSVTERSGVEWNRTAERVEAVSALLYGNLVLEESRGGVADQEETARLLAAKAMDAGVERFVDDAAEWNEFLNRLGFVAGHAGFPAPTDDDIRAAVTALCAGLRSFSELRQAVESGGLRRAVEARLPQQWQRRLDELAPLRIKLPSGRQARVHYEKDRAPWVASRLQDFFGMKETPRVASGRVPLVVHLLAPNQRPVQMTTDLAGFWQRLYPEVRRELSRRYPRHAWPENPG
jgi:ATP-dependent helicase HrpB